MSLAADLAFSTLDKLRERLSLAEHKTIDLTSPMMPEPVGSVRVFAGERISKAVYIGMSVPFIKLDSHMIFAFTKTINPAHESRGSPARKPSGVLPQPRLRNETCLNKDFLVCHRCF